MNDYQRSIIRRANSSGMFTLFFDCPPNGIVSSGHETGLPRSASGTWRDHIQTNHSDDRVRSKIVTNRPPNAELNFKVVKKYRKEGLACLEIELVTGRTHQIRVQGASRFHHVLGDRIYGNFEANRKARRALGLKRFFLHAAAVELKHPGTGKWLRIESPLPDALEEALGRLQ